MDKSSAAGHKIELMDRRDITLSGVTEVKEFSENRVQLKTTMGELCIKGKKLHVSKLNTDTGTLCVSGDIESLRYTTSAGGGLIEGLFK